ncbi:SMI1/KNR4 family protein [Streptomyces sp. NPDC005761]|uniref:SMI1/KNR4 family protein n=1 Tax=Streptomyces sp. NPDC005761 TaxID=3157066 RepID=UPI0033CB6238
MTTTDAQEPGPGPAAPGHPWRDLLQRWSDEWPDPVLHEQERSEPFPAEVRAARWLGGPGATPDELTGLEQRLGCVLPPSYREFLLTSDGWLDTTSEIAGLLPAGEVGRVGDVDPELIEGWGDDRGRDGVPDEEYFVYGEEQDCCALRTVYLSDMLKVSRTPDAGDVYLLNPRVVTPEGEWEAWYLAHWLPGAVRYRSFWDLMNDEYRSFRGDRV